MGEVHELIRVHGADGARLQMGPEKRAIVDHAQGFLSDEGADIGYLYSGFCMVGLPHRKIADDADWKLYTPSATLIVTPGSESDGTMKSGTGGTRKVGVPFGSKARLILLYWQTQAVLTGSPEIELGRSMKNWMERMDPKGGSSAGGKTYKIVREQAKRLALCHMTLHVNFERGTNMRDLKIVDEAFFLGHGPDDEQQFRLWEERIRLSNTFFKVLKEHPVPVTEAAVRQLANNSMALDCYVWLAYRLHALGEDTPISWKALYTQFGTGFKEVRQFRAKFRDALQLALSVYPEARVTIPAGTESVILHPSAPPIPEQRRLRSALGI